MLQSTLKWINSLLNLLQRVQNCAARVIKCASKYDRITPILNELHWLPIKYRIDYKVLLMTYKAVNGLAPPYINELLSSYTPSRSLRSGSENLLKPRKFHCKSFGGRCFEVVAPGLWNNLPSDMRHVTSLNIFKKKLKTYLFGLAFNDS